MVRFKNRWLLIEFIPLDQTKPAQSRLESKHIWAALRDSIQDNFGDVGWGSVSHSLTVKYFSPTTNLCIVRVAREHHQVARGGVTLLKSIDGIRVLPYVIDLTGTIKHAQLTAIEHNRKIVARFRARAGTSASYHDTYTQYLDVSNSEIESLKD